MTTTASPHAVIMSPMCQSARKKCTRYFDMLDSDVSRERVTVLTTRYRQMLPAEKLAFLQELIGPGCAFCPETDELLRRVLAREEAECAVNGDVVHYTNARLVAVQARDPSFICVDDDLPARTAAEGPQRLRVSTVGERKELSHTEKISEILGERGLFGDTTVRLQTERLSMYDRIQSSKNSHASTTDATALASATAAPGDAAAARDSRHSSSSVAPTGVASSRPSMMQPEALTHQPDAAPRTITTSDGHSVPALHRSHAYQTLRLAHSFPHHINTAPANEDHLPIAHIANLSGIPIGEEDLRRWFDSMDAEGSGYLNCQEFLAWMQCLERDFGVQDTYEQLTKEGMRLSQDNKLGFEAFAYLVLRFVKA